MQLLKNLIRESCHDTFDRRSSYANASIFNYVHIEMSFITIITSVHLFLQIKVKKTFLCPSNATPNLHHHWLTSHVITKNGSAEN